MVAAKIQLLMAIGVALSVVHAGPVDNSNGGNNPVLNNKAVCITPQCVQTASGILSDMDPTADPCQDFNQFACGGFEESYEIPSDESSIGPSELLDQRNNRIIRTIVDVSLGKSPKPASGDTASQANLKKLQDFYSSCMDEASILKTGRKPLLDSLQTIAQSFPASDSPASKAILSKALGQMLKSGSPKSSLLSLNVDSDQDEPLVNILSIYETGLGLDAEDYKDAAMVSKYTGTAALMFQVVFGEKDVANRTEPLTDKDVDKKWLDAAKEVVDFEVQLASIRTDTGDLYDPAKSYNPRTIEQLNGLTPSSIDWSVMLQEALPAGVNYTRPFIVTSLDYLTKLDVLLQKTPAKTLQLYFSWVHTQGISQYLASPYRQPLDAFNSGLKGIPLDSKTERWKTCVTAVTRNLGHMVGHYYVQIAFKGNSRQEVIKLMENVLLSYERTFPTLSWLDKITREGALKKLKAIVQTVGYSTVNPDVASFASLEAFYKDYTIEGGDYIGNQFRYNAWDTKKGFEKLEKKTDRLTMDGMIPTEVNAYYSPTFNTINFPAGILQGVFFGVDYPEYVNYGGIGAVGGHEIGHAFDNRGRFYDSTGRPTNWWTNETAQAFVEKSQCFVEQYGNFTVQGSDGKEYNVNGELTLGENLADNGGLRMAFKIWQSRFKSDSFGRKIKNFKLPGLDKYTPEQLFYVSYARTWCGKVRPEALVRRVRTGVHSPYKWRINGVVQNSPDFAKAFGCKAGSAMNPVKKCEVW